MSNKTLKAGNEKTVSALNRRLLTGVLILLALIFVILLILNVRKTVPDHSLSCSTNQELSQKTVTVGSTQLTAEIAKTGEEKQQGLSGRDCLDDGAAMLFPYEVTGDYCFWMKDMRFPIDIVWLDDEMKIVTIKSHALPEKYPETYCSSRPAQYIIEVQNGLAEQLGWQTGTKFSF